jgi:UDP-2-acetamido-3-amino-2,3-dideoxy-glucuronate N-acetyltransferase
MGRYAFVGDGTVVVRDVPDFALVVGNPARIIGWMCMCGNRIAFDDRIGMGACRACGQRYSKVDNSVSPIAAGAEGGVSR